MRGVTQLRILVLLLAASGTASAASGLYASDIERLESEMQRLRADPRIGPNAGQELDDAERALRITETMAGVSVDPQVETNLFITDRALQLAEARGLARYAALREANLQQQARFLAAELQRRDNAAQAAAIPAQPAPGAAAPPAGEGRDSMLLSLGEVRFEFGRAELSPAAQRNLQQIAQAMRDNPRATITVEGHTDAVGSPEANLDLSQRRAEVVRSYLIEQGVPPERITARGLGEEFPTASNADAMGRQLNRRAEVAIREAGTA